MDDRQKSEFNFAVSFLNRLNSAFYLCSNAKIELDLKGWIDSLVILYTELSDDMKDKEIEKKEEELKDLYSEVNIYITQRNKGIMRGVPPELYWKLVKYELFLRKVVKEAGYKTKMVEEAFEALK